MHCAGVLCDAPIQSQDETTLRTVFGPKMVGAYNLHRLTLEYCPPLEHFVLFSSMSALLGLPGQANHSSANTFLDSLAAYRLHVLGLPALSINFGQWGKSIFYNFCWSL
jgi:hypothetical protein